MIILLKMLRGMLKAITSSAAPWQVACGALFGVLLGFLPIFPSAGPALLGLTILFLAIVINCHLGSVLLFFGLGKVLSLMLVNPAVALGNSCSGIAEASADIPFLHHSHWSHTGYLGLTMIGLIAAPLIAVFMAWFTVWLRTKVQEKLAARRKLMAAGKVVGNAMVFKAVCWFLSL
ncbi:MAG: hypothetical protein H0X38_07785 [Planctomycetes bacterium]|nr:hypothetical protein [Planctomycetota bacterium]